MSCCGDFRRLQRYKAYRFSIKALPQTVVTRGFAATFLKFSIKPFWKPRKKRQFPKPANPLRQLALRAAVKRHWREKRQCLSPAFFFVLEKAVKSAGNAVIPTYPMHRSHGLQHLRHKRPTFAFMRESGYTLGFRRRIAHKGSHAETGVFRTGVVSLPSERSARSQTSPGRVSERRTFPLLGLGRVCSRRTQKAFGTAMRMMRVAVPRRRGPAGLRDLFATW